MDKLFKINDLFGKYIYSPKIVKFTSLFSVYVLGLSFCMWISWQLRFDFKLPEALQPKVWLCMLWIVPTKIIFLVITRQFSSLLSFFGIKDLIRLFAAIASSSLLVAILWLIIKDANSLIPPRGVILIDFVFSLMGLASIRLALRLNRERETNRENQKHAKYNKVGIVGAGHSGSNLVKDLFIRKRLGLEPKCFFDDNPVKRKSLLHGIPILGKPEILLDKDFPYNLDKLIIALPKDSTPRIKEVVNIANKAELTCEIVPSVEELTTGQVRISKLRKVQIQDLLQRDPVHIETQNIKNYIQDKVVMVTGAGGSIGSELCLQIANYGARRLLLVEQCEAQIFVIEQELIERGYKNIIVPLVSDVLNLQRMESIFKRYKINFVFHAAAHKHVEMMEQQPVEAFGNNTQGTIVLMDMAVQYAVDQFLLVSTDKAINPTSVMGATKRLAEIFLQSLHAANDTPARFMAVRFGNVLGSSGSVVPIFEKQIDEGGPVTVTHPEVTRFFMTVHEAVGLLLQAASQANGGEIFVLDMGSPVKIIDLAYQLIELHGHKPGRDIEIEFTGLKQGEKLFEEISRSGENIEETEHPKIMRFISQPADLAEVRKQLQEITENLHHLEPDQIKLRFKKVIPEYQPYLS